eukprot:Em0001g1425a
MSIPLFPPMCVVPPVETRCTFFGITIPCVPAVVTTENDDLFGMEVLMGHWITFIILMAIGLLMLSYARWPFTYADAMKITIGLYSIITAFFALFRLGFHVSRLLLIMAALHNLPEWAIFVQVSAANTNSTMVKNGLRAATFFILTIVFLVVMMPTLTYALLAEQAFGIMLDFALPLAFIYQYITGSSKVKSFYLFPAMAHTIHLFFTIIPLVLANFYVGRTSWFSSFFLETSIYVSAPITHSLYARWSFEFDEYKQTETVKDKPTNVLPQDLRVKNVVWFLVIGFLLGLVPLIGLPASLGFCATTPHCTPKDLSDRRKFRIIEHWDSAANRSIWLKDVHDPTFEEPSIRSLLVGEKLQESETYISHYQPSECRKVASGAVDIHLDASCDRVWSVVSNWSDCTWVAGCLYAVQGAKVNARVLHTNEGDTLSEVYHKLDAKERELIYEVVQPGPLKGYTGHLKVADTGREVPGCYATYRFMIPKVKGGVSLDAAYDKLLNVIILAMKKVFKS